VNSQKDVCPAQTSESLIITANAGGFRAPMQRVSASWINEYLNFC